MDGKKLSAAWNTVITDLLKDDEIGPSVKAFLSTTRPLGDLEGTILVAVPNEFTKTFIEKNANDAICSALSNYVGSSVRIAITVDPSLNEEVEAEIDKAEQAEDVAPAVDIAGLSQSRPSTAGRVETEVDPIQAGSQATSSPIDLSGSRLNPKFTFDTFVTGSSNRFANAAATAVGEMPAKAYNPLFIYGGSGLGKTHLLHAIGNYALSLYPNLKVKYVSSEEFTNDFINSIRDDRAEQFQRRYREVDILLIDDIQFIQGKEQTVEEFFHTFNTLHNANKQVVITSDVPPKKLEGLGDRMRSRFEMGLLTDIQPPDLETRIAILRKKAIAENLDVNDEVLEFIASRISSNIRELEGSLLRVTAYAQITNQEINKSLAEVVLKDVLSDPDDTEITIAMIMGQVSDYFQVSIEQMNSADRSRQIVEARQIAMYLCRELTELSLPKIGQAFGGRDHTTVMHANKKISHQMTMKREIFNHVTELISRIRAQARQSQ
ncbi:chromosomal replication initiator protein DnaA [Actinomyces sp.]|uniref:chromosomal replication initiator protein DnaA n=1 Tax=Actinomyces sp. TaxID=29317 RepID=UPI00291342BD|nr:chromosomal replication initiator protein DnaA [Actinomyces sp.]MDU5231233.1 chromosomal replication initiator protein DnaA [Actinomyces sp.]MDU6756734.1 chromosomal replication initiator protein DnaA [Actinomyces sp.]